MVRTSFWNHQNDYFMKNQSDKSLDLLFQKVKEIPPEIPIEKMEKLILNFPNHPILVTETQWFIKLSNLKYIAMTIIPIIVMLTFWWTPVPPETVASIPKTTSKHAITTDDKPSDQPVATLPEQTPLHQVEQSVATPPKPNLDFSQKIVLRNSKSDLPSLISSDSITKIPKDLPKSVKSKKSKKKFNNSATYIKPDFIAETVTPIPDISTPRLKKLRRNLFKNLIDDGIVTSKYALVELELMTNQILLNKEPLPEKFLIKYQGLTEIAGTGPDRKIKMDHDFILVGDFDESGFHGIGVGTFHEELLERKVELFQPISLAEKLAGQDDLLKMENKALKLFANKIQQKTPDGSGRRRLFSPNLNGKNSENLHIDLTLILTEDNFIDEDQEFAFIQLPKDIIRINGQNLSGDQLKKYQNLIDKYGIKHGRERMILLSPHFLKVGNYSYGKFSGTAHTLSFKQ